MVADEHARHRWVVKPCVSPEQATGGFETPAMSFAGHAGTGPGCSSTRAYSAAAITLQKPAPTTSAQA